MLLLCYFIVSLDTILAGGSRHPRETDEFGTVFFFVRERDVNGRASSDAGEAGLNEMRVPRDPVGVQFPQGSQPGSITARSLYSTPRGYRSRHCATHEITAFCIISGFKVSVWLHPALY